MAVPGVSPLDLAAFLWFILCWAGYGFFANRHRSGEHNLVASMDRYRTEWMRRMLARDNRMLDAAIIGTVTRSVSLFASTAIFIVAGLMTVLGAVDEARTIVTTLPFTVETTTQMWEMKILVLLVIFVFAFFKFAWALRQLNHALVAIGAAPPCDQGDLGSREAYAERAGRVVSLAFHSFNRGLRTYYFGMATLTWFIHPVLFMAATLWVVLVIYRREFRSKTLRALVGAAPDNNG